MRTPVLLFIVLLAQIQLSLCFIDPISIGLGGAGLGLLGTGYHKYVKCRLYECCNDYYIPIDVRELQRQLATRLHGQHIVQKSVLGAFGGYKNTENPPKALVISFHGTQGIGKNFVAQLISEIFYKKARRSDFYNWFSGSTFSASRLEQHKEQIKNIVVESLLKCERSMFVFDEVDMMPEGLLDVISPFMDYGQPAFVEYNSKNLRIMSDKSVFIFLSNKGGPEILERMTELRKAGKSRDSMSLSDFEPLITAKAISGEGGFLNSNTIESSLIDSYVPFLPLEESHVRACMRDAFSSRTNETVTPIMEKEVMSIVTYFDEPHNLYVKSGCKRIEQKVISTLY